MQINPIMRCYGLIKANNANKGGTLFFLFDLLLTPNWDSDEMSCPGSESRLMRRMEHNDNLCFPPVLPPAKTVRQNLLLMNINNVF